MVRRFTKLPFLGHFYFTKLLIPTLLSTAKASGSPARIVTVASTGSLMYSGLRFDTFKDSPTRKKLGKEALYLQSKFASIVIAQELARRYGDQGIVTTSLNPGTIDTDLPRHVDSRLQKFFLVRSRVRVLYGCIGLMLYHVRNLLSIRLLLGHYHRSTWRPTPMV